MKFFLLGNVFKKSYVFLAFFTLISFCEIVSEEFAANKSILFSILARNKAHVLPKYLECLDNLDYDKKLITVYINTNNNQDTTQEILQNWAAKNGSQYRDVVFESHEIDGLKKTDPHEWTPERFKVLANIRNKSMKKTKENNCDYYFVVDCDNFIAPNTLKHLLSKDKPIIAPMLRPVPEPQDMYSNFFSDIDGTGYYKDHPNYAKIFLRSMKGTFKVPVVHCTYLIKSDYIDKLNYIDGTDDYEFVIFSRGARTNNVDQYICNEEEFGTLLHFYENVSIEVEKQKFDAIASAKKS